VPALRTIGALVAIVAVVALVVHSGLFADVGPAALRARMESSGQLAPLVYMGLLVVGLFAPVPLLVAGTALGIVPALALCAYLGDAVSDARAWTALLTPGVLVPALLAVAFAVTGTVLGRRVFGDGAP